MATRNAYSERASKFADISFELWAKNTQSSLPSFKTGLLAAVCTVAKSNGARCNTTDLRSAMLVHLTDFLVNALPLIEEIKRTTAV